MLLSAILKLDSVAFTIPLGRAVEGMKAAIRVGGEVSGKLREAFDMGGTLSDLSAQLGETPGRLMVLRQAFEDTGLGAESLQQTLGIMRRSLAGVNESGQPTVRTFQRLGLDIEGLKGSDAQTQLDTIGAAIRNLKTPSDQAAAAMEIFGRSGIRMLTLLKDPNALAAAGQSLGGLPALMDRNANAFDGVSDAIGRIKQKGMGIWAGIAEGLVPLAQGTTGWLDSIDLTAAGQRVGRFLGTTVQLFRDAPVGQTLRDALVVGFGEALNKIVQGFVNLGGVLMNVLATPVSYFEAAIGKAIQQVMEWIGKIPKLGKALGLEGFEAESFGALQSEARDRRKAEAAEAMEWTGKLIDTGDATRRLGEAWSAAADSYAVKIKEAQDTANATAFEPGEGAFDLSQAGKKKGADREASIPTDSLARIGLFVGGGDNGMVGLARQTLDVNRRMLDGIQRLVAKPAAAGVWA